MNLLVKMKFVNDSSKKMKYAFNIYLWLMPTIWIFNSAAFNPIQENLRRNQDVVQIIDYEEKGDLAISQKQWEAAKNWFEKALESDTKNAELHFKYGAVLSVLASKSKLKALHFKNEIRNQFETTLSLQPKHIQAHYALVEYYLQVPGILGGSVSKAQSYVNRLKKISEIDGLLSQARIYEYEEKFAEARKSYHQAIAKFNSKSAKEKLEKLDRISPKQ